MCVVCVGVGERKAQAGLFLVGSTTAVPDCRGGGDQMAFLVCRNSKYDLDYIFLLCVIYYKCCVHIREGLLTVHLEEVIVLDALFFLWCSGLRGYVHVFCSPFKFCELKSLRSNMINTSEYVKC